MDFLGVLRDAPTVFPSRFAPSGGSQISLEPPLVVPRENEIEAWRRHYPRGDAAVLETRPRQVCPPRPRKRSLDLRPTTVDVGAADARRAGGRSTAGRST